VSYPWLAFNLRDQGQGLKIKSAAQGDDQPAAFLKLIKQRRGNMIGGAGDDNGIERRLLFPAKIAVRPFDLVAKFSLISTV
jgi:hypothetical protein